MFGEPSALPERSDDETQQLFYELSHMSLRRATAGGQQPPETPMPSSSAPPLTPLLSTSQRMELARRLPALLHLPPSDSREAQGHWGVAPHVGASPIGAAGNERVQQRSMSSGWEGDRASLLASRLMDISRGGVDVGGAMAALGEAEEILRKQQRATAALDAEEARIRAIMCNSRSSSVVGGQQEGQGRPVGASPSPAYLPGPGPKVGASVDSPGPAEGGSPQSAAEAASQYYAWYYWHYAMWCHHLQQQQQQQLQQQPRPQPHQNQSYDADAFRVLKGTENRSLPAEGSADSDFAFRGPAKHAGGVPQRSVSSASTSSRQTSSVYDRKQAELAARRAAPRWQT
jgi:hypothetical protein